MTDLQAAKLRVREVYLALDQTPATSTRGVLAKFCSAEVQTCGVHPFDAQRGIMRVGLG